MRKSRVIIHYKSGFAYCVRVLHNTYTHFICFFRIERELTRKHCQQSHPKSQQPFPRVPDAKPSSYLCASPFARADRLTFSSHKTNQSRRNFAGKFLSDGTASAASAECTPTLPFSTMHWLSEPHTLSCDGTTAHSSCSSLLLLFFCHTSSSSKSAASRQRLRRYFTADTFIQVSLRGLCVTKRGNKLLKCVRWTGN